MAIQFKSAFVAGALFICAYFFYFAGSGVWAYFDPDDAMNLFGWWSQPAGKLIRANLLWFSPAYRPMGGLFYTAIFRLFGLHPLPFRLAAFAFLLLNLLWVYLVARRLTSSREIAALTTLIASYHPGLFDIYQNTATIYDVLCFFFYFAAFWYYLRARQRGGPLNPRQLLVFSALYIAALDSKEMAATLPAVLAAYELFYAPPESWSAGGLGRWLARQARGAWLIALLTAPFVIGKTMVPSSAFYHHPAYTSQFSWTVFEKMSADYLQQLFQNSIDFNVWRMILLWATLLALALATRSAALSFCWVFIMLTPLPVEFLTLFRGGYVLYIPIFGWAMYAAVLLVKARDLLLWKIRRAGPAPAGAVEARQVALFVGTALLLIPAHRQIAPDTYWLPVRQQEMRYVIEPMSRQFPKLQRGAALLFLDDPLSREDWANDYTMYFTICLYYRDPTLRVERARMTGRKPADPDLAAFDYVLRLEKQRVVVLKSPPESRAVVQAAQRPPATAEVLNLSRPGTRDFLVGERFRVIVTGAPQQVVTCTSSQKSWGRVEGRTGADRCARPFHLGRQDGARPGGPLAGGVESRRVGRAAHYL